MAPLAGIHYVVPSIEYYINNESATSGLLTEPVDRSCPTSGPTDAEQEWGLHITSIDYFVFSYEPL